MTDKQIACNYISRRLWEWIPEHEVLREIAETKLTEDRCYRIVELIGEMVDKIRQPLIDHLNKTGQNTT